MAVSRVGRLMRPAALGGQRLPPGRPGRGRSCRSTVVVGRAGFPASACPARPDGSQSTWLSTCSTSAGTGVVGVAGGAWCRRWPDRSAVVVDGRADAGRRPPGRRVAARRRCRRRRRAALGVAAVVVTVDGSSASERRRPVPVVDAGARRTRDAGVDRLRRCVAELAGAQRRAVIAGPAAGPRSPPADDRVSDVRRKKQQRRRPSDGGGGLHRRPHRSARRRPRPAARSGSPSPAPCRSTPAPSLRRRAAT